MIFWSLPIIPQTTAHLLTSTRPTWKEARSFLTAYSGGIRWTQRQFFRPVISSEGSGFRSAYSPHLLPPSNLSKNQWSPNINSTGDIYVLENKSTPSLQSSFKLINRVEVPYQCKPNCSTCLNELSDSSHPFSVNTNRLTYIGQIYFL